MRRRNAEKKVDPNLIVENELPKTGARYEKMLNDSWLKVQMMDILESYDKRPLSLDQGQSYFNSIKEKTGITCELVEKWSIDGTTVKIPLGLPSRWIKAIMEYHDMPREVLDIVVKWYKHIYAGSKWLHFPEYDLKIVLWENNYIISPVDMINLKEVLSEEEKQKWIDYLKNRKTPLKFFEQENWQLLDIHDEDWPYWWGKILYMDSSYESYEDFKYNCFPQYSFPDIDKDQYKKWILIIVPYWTYEWNHDSSYPFILPVDDELSKKIEIICS